MTCHIPNHSKFHFHIITQLYCNASYHVSISWPTALSHLIQVRDQSHHLVPVSTWLYDTLHHPYPFNHIGPPHLQNGTLSHVDGQNAAKLGDLIFVQGFRWLYSTASDFSHENKLTTPKFPNIPGILGKPC